MNEVPCKQKYKTQQNGYTEPSMHNQIAWLSCLCTKNAPIISWEIEVSHLG
jgi:hypothetical protein